jgi:hypothetical protein
MWMKEEQRAQARNTICGWERPSATLRDAITSTAPVLNGAVNIALCAPAAGTLEMVLTGVSAIAANECEQHCARRFVCDETQQECARSLCDSEHDAQHSGGARFATRARSIAMKTARRIAPFYVSRTRRPAPYRAGCVCEAPGNSLSCLNTGACLGTMNARFTVDGQQPSNYDRFLFATISNRARSSGFPIS